ncbi:class I SAM-dependent methyltransferase [Limnoglobus roseus]|uniref:class I SAM-dependent methyltransferase n=1 Tax=Limnoglobus roseus TaxID=2598579 RepID=UPI00143DCF88|nr:SAM-dependent methyltransferase [Limnoglobus roseus]
MTAVLGGDFVRATFGGLPRRDPGTAWIRVVVRPVEVRGEPRIQFEQFERRQAFTKNETREEAEATLRGLHAIGFANVYVRTRHGELEIRLSKKGKAHVSRRSVGEAVPDSGHNRQKELPLPEGRADRLLETMGILTADGQVRASMRPKFTQINEFLKHLQHVLEPTGLKSHGRPVEILDCGCGSSYLTLAVHHYLNHVLGVPATLLGVDVNESVIRKSVEKAERLKEEGLSFACGRIGEMSTRADIVVALHACDTATDDAVAQAVRSEAKLLMSVPCCHHHLNRLLQAAGPAEALKPMLRHGILHERTADILTDSFRALALRVMGYRVDVVEFVSPEHTARNLMIRAVRTGHAGEVAAVREYRALKEFWGVTPYIETALGEPFQRLMAGGV